ncbi:MAG: transmembrane 220 family protein [Fulvivirga sp.]
MKIISLTLAILFMGFAAVQYNDTDPLQWMLIYGYVAVIPILYLFKVYPVRLILLTIVAGTVLSVFYIPGIIDWLQQGTAGELTQEMKATKPYIEESREFFGLFLALLTLLFYYVQEKKLVAVR